MCWQADFVTFGQSQASSFSPTLQLRAKLPAAGIRFIFTAERGIDLLIYLQQKKGIYIQQADLY